MPDPCFDKPSHVAANRIVDVDIYGLPGSEHDLHAAWKHIQDATDLEVLWTPRNGGHWLATRGRPIARIYADHHNYSSNITIVPREIGEQFPLRPTTLDPPAHRPFRRLINGALTTRMVRGVEPTIRAVAKAAVSQVKDHGQCEFIFDVANQIPLCVFMHLAGLPPDCGAELPRYGDQPEDTPVMQRFADFLRPKVAERRRQPGRDLLSHLANGQVDGRLITEHEAVELATAMLTGGIDTVISSAGFMMAFLARNPDHRQQLADNPKLIPAAVAEMLRRFPIMTKARLVKTDQELDGATLKAGDMVVLPPLHGLDEREFDDPLRVDFARDPGPNSAFGNGVHHCPGYLLAQTELTIILETWLNTIPDFQLDPAQPVRMQCGILGAMLQLGLIWDPPSSSAGCPAQAGAQT